MPKIRKIEHEANYFIPEFIQNKMTPLQEKDWFEIGFALLEWKESNRLPDCNLLNFIKHISDSQSSSIPFSLPAFFNDKIIFLDTNGKTTGVYNSNS